MGVPAFFRWLSRKYPSIIVHCIEEKAPVMTAGLQHHRHGIADPNPNRVEFDNLYLDMNGIIHPCCHPENKAAPKDEDEMMVEIFSFIDRLVNIVRPRKLLYMAIDGVAPRAKMNQQRSRRFRSAKESIDKMAEIKNIREKLLEAGHEILPEKKSSEHFDSNCITPGTEFMFRLADCLRYYVHERINNCPGWENLKVVLSDANCPGEGEHKIMDYIRHQRSQPDHDPNTHHCLCGADGWSTDLIMLGLATHEPHFTIIREEFRPNKPKPCELCGQMGHDYNECRGISREVDNEKEKDEYVGEELQFIFLRLNILREYLEKELFQPGSTIEFDIERSIDDWVFMCFFVGNDFLPHLPSLQIRENAIDRLIRIYKDIVVETKGYVTESGFVDKDKVQMVLTRLGKMEDQIFRTRQDNDRRYNQRQNDIKRRKLVDSPAYTLGGQFTPSPISQSPRPIVNPAAEISAGMRRSLSQSQDVTPKSQGRRSYTQMDSSVLSVGSPDSPVPSKIRKVEEDNEPKDEVRLGESGWRDRYYLCKFGVKSSDPIDVGPRTIMFGNKVAEEYVLGLCWVLQYYYQGCPSWTWFYPYHYAPFASDFVNVIDVDTEFDRSTKPFKPLEQLMGVFPAASGKFLPPSWEKLMMSANSSIIDFYPTDFKIDLNGKKYAWQGVALLPFVDEPRLLNALSKVYPNITMEEKFRNGLGNDRLFVGKKHSAYVFFQTLYEGGDMTEWVDIPPKFTEGLSGTVKTDEFAVPSGKTFTCNVRGLHDVMDNGVITMAFRDPQYKLGFRFPSNLLPNVKMPDKCLKPTNWEAKNPGKRYEPMIGMARGGPKMTMSPAGQRMLGNAMMRRSTGSSDASGSYYQGYQVSQNSPYMAGNGSPSSNMYSQQDNRRNSYGPERPAHGSPSYYQRNTVYPSSGAMPSSRRSYDQFDNQRYSTRSNYDNSQRGSYSASSGSYSMTPSRPYSNQGNQQADSRQYSNQGIQQDDSRDIRFKPTHNRTLTYPPQGQGRPRGGHYQRY